MSVNKRSARGIKSRKRSFVRAQGSNFYIDAEGKVIKTDGLGLLEEARAAGRVTRQDGPIALLLLLKP